MKFFGKYWLEMVLVIMVLCFVFWPSNSPDQTSTPVPSPVTLDTGQAPETTTPDGQSEIPASNPLVYLIAFIVIIGGIMLLFFSFSDVPASIGGKFQVGEGDKALDMNFTFTGRARRPIRLLPQYIRTKIPFWGERAPQLDEGYTTTGRGEIARWINSALKSAAEASGKVVEEPLNYQKYLLAYAMKVQFLANVILSQYGIELRLVTVENVAFGIEVSAEIQQRTAAATNARTVINVIQILRDGARQVNPKFEFTDQQLADLIIELSRQATILDLDRNGLAGAGAQIASGIGIVSALNQTQK